MLRSQSTIRFLLEHGLRTSTYERQMALPHLPEYAMPIIAPYRDDDGGEPRPCERAVLTSGTKCTASIVLCDENGKHHFLCMPHAAQNLSGNQDLLASAVIELALTVGVPMNAWEFGG
jgi:hypothetical protein